MSNCQLIYLFIYYTCFEYPSKWCTYECFLSSFASFLSSFLSLFHSLPFAAPFSWYLLLFLPRLPSTDILAFCIHDCSSSVHQREEEYTRILRIICHCSCSVLDMKTTQLNQKQTSHFSSFNCCLGVVLQLNKGDYPENLHVAFCRNKQRSF